MKKVLDLSVREALQLGHSYIGTEHLLLGLMREGDGVGVRVLHALGGESEQVRQAVIRAMFNHRGSAADSAVGTISHGPVFPRCAGCSANLEQDLRYRSKTIPPTSPNPFPLTVDVVYCGK